MKNGGAVLVQYSCLWRCHGFDVSVHGCTQLSETQFGARVSFCPSEMYHL